MNVDNAVVQWLVVLLQEMEATLAAIEGDEPWL